MLRIFYCLLIFFVSCKPLQRGYDTEISIWQEDRLKELVQEDGWVTLVGLFPLKEGTQSFGSATTSDIQFPDFAPQQIGIITVKDDEVILRAHADANILVDGVPITNIKLFPTDLPVVCTLGRLEWFIIKRTDRYFIRVRDTEHPARKTLQNIPSYPINPAFKLTARFHAYETPRNLPLPNALDMIVDGESPGYLTFEYEQKQYSLLALEEGPELFILFYDETSGQETYGGGRYLYVNKPDNNGLTTIDFNKAYSPPCAFTEFATCLLPPLENRLPFPIRAGEKDPHFLNHH
jgi:uncharacterized protein (DUF1684 family)